jgi:ABC-2 type transport system permease protein
MTTTTSLDPRWVAARAGLLRGWIETRHVFTETASVIGYLILPVTCAVALLLMRGKTVPGTDFDLGAMALPSFLGMSIAFGGLVGPASTIATDREEGTLLRAKATPNGMLGYLVGKIAMLSLTTLLGFIAIVIVGSLLADGPLFGARAWLLIALIFVAGMVATVPLGVALGSLMKSSAQAFLLMFIPAGLLIYPSGIFTPITTLPTWLQWVGQALPFYWVGLGARSAMLPAEMVAVEIGQSWRTLETFAVLGLWAAIGLIFAPILLRRMARGESGSTLAATRERIMSKGY